LQERKKFLKDSGISRFFDDIYSAPNEEHAFAASEYSIALFYIPSATGPSFGGGLLQEAAKTIKEHAVYRELNRKAAQHRVDGPRVICIGSDQSPALSRLIGPGQPTVREAVIAAFRQHHSLSATIVVRIETSFTSLHNQFDRQAHGDFYGNPYARDLLTEQEAQVLCKLHFNRWRYTYPLEKLEQNNNERLKRVTGSLTCSFRGVGMKIEVPANILMDVLAGKTSLIKACDLSEDDPIAKALQEEWVVESCSLKSGNIESGEASKVVLELIPASLGVYWPS